MLAIQNVDFSWLNAAVQRRCQTDIRYGKSSFLIPNVSVSQRFTGGEQGPYYMQKAGPLL